MWKVRYIAITTTRPSITYDCIFYKIDHKVWSQSVENIFPVKINEKYGNDETSYQIKLDLVTDH